MNYKHSSYDNYTHLPLQLVRKAIAKGWENSLCYFVWMRKVHRKPIFYNYTLRKVSSKVNCSPATIGFHIAILKREGLIYIKDGHLHLKGSTKLLQAHGSILVPVLVKDTKADQLTAIRYVTVKKELHYQDKAIQLKKDIIKLHERKFTKYADAKRLLKAQRRLNFDVETSEVNENLILSNKKLGLICHRSQRTGIKIQKAFNKLGLVQTKRNTILLEKGHNRRSFFEKCLNSSHQLSSKGNIFKVLPNTWVIIGDAQCSAQQIKHSNEK